MGRHSSGTDVGLLCRGHGTVAKLCPSSLEVNLVQFTSPTHCHTQFSGGLGSIPMHQVWGFRVSLLV